MHKLSSYTAIKNLAFGILIMVMVITVIHTVKLTNDVYEDTFVTAKDHYHDMIAQQAMVSNAKKTAYNVFINNIKQQVTTPDELLIPLESLIQKSQFIYDNETNKQNQQLINKIISDYKAIRAGLISLMEIKSSPSHSDTIDILKKTTICERTTSIYSQLEKISISSHNMSHQVAQLVTILTEFENTLRAYYDEDTLDNETSLVLLKGVLETVQNIHDHEDIRSELDTITNNLKVILLNMDRLYLYKTNESYTAYFQEETTKLNQVWEETIYLLQFIMQHEAEHLAIIETELIEKWRKNQRLYMIIATVGICLALYLSFLLSRTMNMRLQRQLDAINSFSKGNKTNRLEVMHDDYIGKISAAFNNMADTIMLKDEQIQTTLIDLYETNEMLEQYKQSLEEKVEQRTSELSDITSQLQSEVEVRKKKEQELILFEKIYEHSNEAIFVTDKDAIILSANKAFTKTTGFSEEEVIGSNPSILKSGKHNDDFYKRMWEILLENNEWAGEVWNKRKDQTIFPAFISIYAILNQDQEIEYFVGIQRDITDLKTKQEELRQKAFFYDSLTSLPNRALLFDRLNVAINMAKRDNDKIAVMFLDLDRFKSINDTYGHDAGDNLLKQVAGRLLLCAREADTVCRLGGDEFVIILNHAGEKEAVEQVAVRIIESIKKPFDLNGIIINTSTSIGITMFPMDGENSEKLMKNADLAMYKAKSIQRGTYQFYTPSLDNM